MDKNDPRRHPTDEELDDLNEHWHDPGDPDGVVAAEERQQWQVRNANPQPIIPKTKRRRHRLLKLVVGLLLLAAATAGAYWFGGRQASPSAPATSTTTRASTPTPAPKVAVVSTKHYDSVTYSIGFDYPQSWQLVDTTTKLTVASPLMQFKTVDAKQVSGHVLLTVRNKQTVISEFADGPASAALASDKLTYKQPTSIQRAQSYVSFLSFAKSSTGSLDAVYLTGDAGYQQNQSIPMAAVVKGDPLISLTFVNCINPDCATGTVTPYSVASATWADPVVGKPVTALLQSLTLN